MLRCHPRCPPKCARSSPHQTGSASDASVCFMFQSRLMSEAPLCNCGQPPASLPRHDTRWANCCRGPAKRAVLLLVQPGDDGLHMYAEFLSSHGLAVIAVSDAWDALIAAPKADVIVTGILLAGSMDGVELISRLRRDEHPARRPIIVLTACAWDAERERATHAGCDRFLAKPCVPSELLRHVRASLAEAAPQRVRGQPVKAELLNAPCVTRSATGWA